MTTLFDSCRFGDITTASRIVMAPLTRDRAGPGQVPTEMMATYYTQRASAGLIITEATQISPEGQGYLDTPGIYSPAQVAGWRRVTDAVHAAGGKIVFQLWHVGRISHVSLQPNGQPPVSSTARRAAGKTFTAAGFEDVSQPRALRLDEMPRVVADYRHAARCAIDAGFDGADVIAHQVNDHQVLRAFLVASEQFGREGEIRLPGVTASSRSLDRLRLDCAVGCDREKHFGGCAQQCGVPCPEKGPVMARTRRPQEEIGLERIGCHRHPYLGGETKLIGLTRGDGGLTLGDH